MELFKSEKSKTVAKYAGVIAIASLVGMAPMIAQAVQAPAQGSFGYDLYDIFVDKGINGAPGFVGGVIGVAWSASQLAKSWVLSGLGIGGSTVLLKAESVTTTLGALVS